MTTPVSLTPQIVQECFQWDVRTWKKCLDEWGPVLRTGKKLRCLDVGSRDGGLTLLLALHGHEVVCTDLEAPGISARDLHRKYGVDSLVTYQAMDATAIPFKETFDVVIFKSVLGGIGRDGHTEKQLLALDQLFHSLRPNGTLLFAENLSASMLHRALRKIFNRWGTYWNYPTVHWLRNKLEEHGDVSMKTTGFLAAFGRSEKQREFLARLDDAFICRVVPTSWRYVAYGWVRKGQ